MKTSRNSDVTHRYWSIAVSQHYWGGRATKESASPEVSQPTQ